MDIYDITQSKTITKFLDTFLFSTKIQKNNKICELVNYESATLLLANDKEELLIEIPMDINIESNTVSCIVPRQYIVTNSTFYFQVKLVDDKYRYYVPTTYFGKISVIDNLDNDMQI